MFQDIYVPVDNSAFSNRAVDLALSLGRATGAKLVGSHVYAARMHDYRFKQMEYTLPEEYLQERELERQRKIHDSLITMGLELISDSYLDQMKQSCEQRGLQFEGRMMDGKHFEELIKDIDAHDYDLTIMGAHGIGKVRDSDLGSVTAQVTRHVNRDIWVVKNYKTDKTERDTILVAVDGSPKSFGGLRQAMRLARLFDKKIELISVYDPYLHYSVFSGIVDVLSEKAKKVFRFEEQNQLHEEIIDTGLASIYQSHLNVAEAIARDAGFEVTKTLLDGKAFQKILDHARKTEPWLLMLGRIGVHSEETTAGLGNTTENLLRLVPCDIYLNSHSELPKLDLKAEESIRWTDEAKERMTRVPSLVRGIARTAILRMAIEQGHSVITDSLILEAMDRFMPKSASKMTVKLAEAVALERATEQPTAICKHCGITAKEADPVKCAVCGSNDFETISREMIDKIAATEGGIEEDASYDGRKLKWTREARLELRGIKDAYQRRRAKARVEKTARIRHLEAITLEHVQEIIREELGNLPIDVEREPEVLEQPQAEPAAPQLPLVGTDEAGHPMHSALNWQDDALQRMLRVPAGFMRERTQGRVEEVAREMGETTVTMVMVEEGLERGRQMMNQLLAQAGGDMNAMLENAPQEIKEAVKSVPEGVCPFHAAQQKTEAAPAAEPLNEVESIHFANR
ncbi:MAG: universal stress protein [Acidobacteriota bacterium]|nr:universal stress protein [Acidobacteriota bacterium]